MLVEPGFDDAVRVAFVGGPEERVERTVLGSNGFELGHGSGGVGWALAWQRIDGQSAAVVVIPYIDLPRRVEQHTVIRRGHGGHVLRHAAVVVASTGGV